MKQNSSLNWDSVRNLFLAIVFTVISIPLLIVLLLAINSLETASNSETPSNQDKNSPQNETQNTTPTPEAKFVLLGSDPTQPTLTSEESEEQESTSNNNPPQPPPTRTANTFTVTVTSTGNINPTSLTITAGDIINFTYPNPNDEVILTFSPKPPNDIKLDHDSTQRTYTFSKPGTYSYHKKDGGITQATIFVQ